MKRTGPLAKAVTALAVSALALTGCGGGDSAAADGDVELRFAWWGSDTRHQQTQKIIDAFEEENPGITVTGEYGDWSGYWDKLATQTASSDAPDVIQMEEKYIREYADNGALLDLSDVDVSEIDEGVVESGRTEEGLFGVATGVNIMALVANPALFEEAGVELPDDSTWTWQDYSDVAAQITENSDAYGASGPNEPAGFQIWLRQQGKEMTTPEGELGFEVADAAEYLELQKQLIEDGALPPASVLTEDQSPGPDQSLTGTNGAAMGMWWTNQLSALNAASGNDLLPLRFPSTDGAEGGAQLFQKSAMFMSGSARTEHPEEVKKFIDFMVNSEEAGLLNLADRGLPANQSVREAVLPELDEADTMAAEFIEEVQPELGDPLPIPPLGFSSLQEILYRYELDVAFDRASPQEAAERMISEMESAIS
ncbi:ABC transporter substrate-binding protein [Kocuria sp. CNJ-770]|uniref:ABC transporter substrate-binding protein n=1 Tax=Kocuria sp. CNJ-770 TaxID=1904964 RepID=UPI00095993CF|nr:extracellular solute-binding protein [Kocuria sp. CNJ-770]OLT08034.1 ABC transporter substrate-binding protein [Kocuria sp. CNJ-770]